MNELNWIKQPTQKEDISLTLDDDIPYTRDSIRNLRFHQPVQVIAMKAVSGISVKKSLEIDERRTISVIMDEVKNMLDYKVGHYFCQAYFIYVQ